MLLFRNCLTVVVSLEHFNFLLIIRATEKLTLLDDILIALLQSDAAHHTYKAFQMKHVVDGAHN